MTQNTIRIVAAIVDTAQLTLYKEDGKTIVIPQGDPRLRRIVDDATPQLVAQGYADIEVDKAGDNTYAQFEAECNGVVKFFRIAKAKLKELLPLGLIEDKGDVVAPVVLGSMTQTLQAVNEIIKHAVPAASPDFHERNVAQQADVVEEDGKTPGTHTADDHPETIIAVVGDKVVPGVEKIKNQFARAAKLGTTVGVENFLRRLGNVIEKRSHSVEDLLKFMERGDLPIAEDGSILIYKVLRRRGEKSDGRYVDCHTGKVPQWTGAYVCMDDKLVDHNRNNECSNGLHVARRGYIYGFNGDVCVIAKLAPEDVITVPAYDANKMRVCGYHILMELSDKQYSLLKGNRPLTDDEEGKRLLANALAGRHVRRTHEVRVTEQRGGGVVIKELEPAEASAPVASKDAPKEAEALDNASKAETAPAIDPKAVVKTVEKVSRQDQATRLYQNWRDGVPGAEAELRAFKKAAKVGWAVLGIPTDKDGQPVLKGVKAAQVLVKVKVQPQVMQVELDGEQDRRRLQLDDNPAPNQGSPRERIAKLLAIGIRQPGIAEKVLEIKKASKKSWENLGVKASVEEQIMKLVKQ